MFLMELNLIFQINYSLHLLKHPSADGIMDQPRESNWISKFIQQRSALDLIIIILIK